MLVAFDTNILGYVEGVNSTERRKQAEAIVASLRPEEVMIPAQVLAELFFIPVRRLKTPAVEAREKVVGWMQGYTTIDTSPAILVEAMQLTDRHRIAWWDAIILASARSAGCSELLSEDFQHGFTWRGVSVRNPFLA